MCKWCIQPRNALVILVCKKTGAACNTCTARHVQTVLEGRVVHLESVRKVVPVHITSSLGSAGCPYNSAGGTVLHCWQQQACQVCMPKEVCPDLALHSITAAVKHLQATLARTGLQWGYRYIHSFQTNTRDRLHVPGTVALSSIESLRCMQLVPQSHLLSSDLPPSTQQHCWLEGAGVVFFCEMLLQSC